MLQLWHADTHAVGVGQHKERLETEAGFSACALPRLCTLEQEASANIVTPRVRSTSCRARSANSCSWMGQATCQGAGQCCCTMMTCERQLYNALPHSAAAGSKHWRRWIWTGAGSREALKPSSFPCNQCQAVALEWKCVKFLVNRGQLQATVFGADVSILSNRID